MGTIDSSILSSPGGGVLRFLLCFNRSSNQIRVCRLEWNWESILHAKEKKDDTALLKKKVFNALRLCMTRRLLTVIFSCVILDYH